MIDHCPNCQKALNFSEVQQAKIKSALTTVGTGTLKIKCPMCSGSIEMMADGTPWQQKSAPAAKSASGRKTPEPPRPPDIDWLTKGVFEEKETIRDIPKVLILIDKGEVRDRVTGAMVESFFQPLVVDTVDEAMEQMQAIQFNAVVLHSKFAGGSLGRSKFHEFMRRMPMNRRRYIFYLLIGPEFHTLYAMEALANSANLVVSEKEVEHMKNIYKRGKAEYDQLFGPYVSALKDLGSSS